ncbi:MAG: OmpH family outer membrane protein [Rhodospirillaceae bacterium]
MTLTLISTVRRTALMAAVVGLAAISGIAGAQAQERRPAVILGVVNTDRIMQDSLAAKGVRLEREKYAQTYQTQIKDEEAKLRAEDQELASQRSVMAPEVFQQRAQAFQQKLAEFQNQVRDKQERLDFSFQQALQEIGNTIIIVSQEIAKQQGITAVAAHNQLLFFDPGMDITAPVLERLNQRLSAVKFQDPATLQAQPQPGAAPPAAAAPAAKAKAK